MFNIKIFYSNMEKMYLYLNVFDFFGILMRNDVLVVVGFGLVMIKMLIFFIFVKFILYFYIQVVLSIK